MEERLNDSVFGNSNVIGIGAEGEGVTLTNIGHKAWREDQYQSYIRGVKALQALYGIRTARVLGHHNDPDFSMTDFRAALA